jgi:ABC-type Zn2+ transport system substrate-binding protein/surface adhesin
MFNCSCHHYCYRCSVQLSQPHQVIKYSKELEDFLQKPVEEVVEQQLEQINIEVEEANTFIEESANGHHRDYYATYRKRKQKKPHKKYVSDSEPTSADESSSDLEPGTLAYIDDLYSKSTTPSKFNFKEVKY